MKYVYMLQSLEDSERYYVGSTDDLKERLKYHNAGKVVHTSKYKPWRVNTYIAFSDEKRARVSSMAIYLSIIFGHIVPTVDIRECPGLSLPGVPLTQNDPKNS